ncbi:MAG: type II toxin-antitoxin system VapC family toxin [Planctomycetes bacterium]|nr:type II toxin-antitoxin system VapC family toxin [Planctomycetota bacterium]
MSYLLDTCVWIWLCSDPARLSARASAALDDERAELLFSDAAALEIALKWAAGKIALPKPPRLWIEEQLALWQARSLPISRPAIYRSTELAELHRDPFDRLLVATALEEGATLVTPDPWIQRYPVAWIW